MREHPPPFAAFDAQHVAALVVILAITVILPLAARACASERTNRRLGAVLGGLLLFVKAFEPVFRIATGAVWYEVLPLHLCDVGGVLTGVVLLSRNRWVFELSYFWGLGATLPAVLTPDLQHGFPHPDYFFFFSAHGLVVVGVLYATVVFRLRPPLTSVWRTMAATVAYALLIIPVNLAFGTNYLYLCRKPPAVPLFDYFGPWPWYLLPLVGLGILLFLLCYAPFGLADGRRRRV